MIAAPPAPSDVDTQGADDTEENPVVTVIVHCVVSVDGLDLDSHDDLAKSPPNPPTGP